LPAWEDRRELRTTASPERAWRAWADPVAIQGWFADEAEGRAEPGSVLIHRFPAMGLEIRQDVVEAVPGERLVLRLAFPGRPPMTQEIVVRAAAGETVIELVNSGFGAEEWEGQFEGIDSGWKLALAQLRHYLENHWGRRRHVWLALRPAKPDWQRLASLLRDGPSLSRWLTAPASGGSGMAGGIGSPVSLALRNFTPLTGRVLADSGRELLLSWEELDGALELKAFATGPASAMVGLRLSTWAAASPSAVAIQQWLDGCADRLAAASSG
jgi:uncharacterized protein YndB with AHSA1/START domain